MILDQLLPLFGYSEVNGDLIDVVKGAGFDLGALSKSTLRNQGMVGIELPEKGLALTFNEREDYIDAYAAPKDGGEAILVAVFAYGAGSKSFKPYPGPIPFTQTAAITDRNAALREFGNPDASEDEDGIVDWDQWFKGGLQVRAAYRENGSIKHIMYSVPLKTAQNRTAGSTPSER